MANYIFSQVNTGVEIVNPNTTVVGVNDNFNGSCTVSVLLSVAASPQAKSAKFSVELIGFTYTDDWTQSEINDWVVIELVKYEV